MVRKIRLVIIGFGNIGRCVLEALPQYRDFECVGIITRNPARVIQEVSEMTVFDQAEEEWTLLDIDVAILCGGSKNDLPIQGPLFAKHFNTVCSFDTHAHIDDYVSSADGAIEPGYYHIMDDIAMKNGNTSMVCQGWDPGIFSMMRALFTSCLGGAKAEGFYGLSERGGLSMGHSDALRTIPGVKDARQYTHANLTSVEYMRSGTNSTLLPGQMHWRECFIVAEEGADLESIKKQVVSMPNYFEPFGTTVEFISQEELDEKHSSMPHDGLVIGVSKYGSMEFHNQWKSNPAGTAGILLAFARAAVRFNNNRRYGAYTSLEVPIKDLLPNPDKFLTFV